jgi:hypothetical protein
VVPATGPGLFVRRSVRRARKSTANKRRILVGTRRSLPMIIHLGIGEARVGAEITGARP